MATDRLINKDQGDQIITKLDAIKTAMQTQTDGIVSDAFNENASYYAGDYCINNDTLYKFTSDHSGAWDLADVTATNVGDELASIKSALSWKLVGNDFVAATGTISLSGTSFKEALLVARFASTAWTAYCTNNLLTKVSNIRTGNADPSNDWTIDFAYSNGQVSILTFSNNGTDKKSDSNAKFAVYYR